jgi:hypothetical protein
MPRIARAFVASSRLLHLRPCWAETRTHAAPTADCVVAARPPRPDAGRIADPARRAVVLMPQTRGTQHGPMTGGKLKRASGAEI